METLSSSVSTLKVASIHSTLTPEFHNLSRTPITYHQFHNPQHSHLTSSTNKPNNAFTRARRQSFSAYSSPLTPSGTSTPKSAPPPNSSHQKPASGYAAALLDKALCQGSLEPVLKDAVKLSRLLKNEHIQAMIGDPFAGEKEKREIVKQVVSSIGKVNRYLSALLRMLIERNKVAMVGDVLDEFLRIYDELIGTRVVFASSEKKMQEDQLFDLAKRVQQLSGAAQLKIRNSVDDGVPSFAV